MGKFKKQFFAIFAILIYAIIINITETEAISVVPGRIEIVIPAGESYEGEFIITNTENEPVRAVVSPAASIGNEEIDSSKWIKLSVKEAKIAPKGSVKVKYKVVVPKGVKGEYMPTVTFREEPVLREPMAYAQIRMPIYLIIRGTEVYKGKLESVKIVSAKPLIVSIIVRNDGNIHTRPSGTLTIKQLSATVASLNINDSGGPVFSGGIGDVGGKFTEVNIASGTYIAELELQFSPGIMFNKKVSFEVNDKSEVKMLKE